MKNKKILSQVTRLTILALLIIDHGLRAQDKNDTTVISLNQSGYNYGWPKRFTAPLSANGTAFFITGSESAGVLYSGKINKGVGDFSAFDPDPGRQYIVRVNKSSSYPFSIDRFWLENEQLQPALDFMIDDRSITGTHPSAFGGAPWRDGTFYSYEVPSMVMLYLSNPDFYDNAPAQIVYMADKKKVLSTDFRYRMEAEGETALQTTRKYFKDIDAPVGTHIPDIIQLIHWGIGYYLINPVTRDPSGGEEGRKLHPQTLEQFAYFLYGYPYYKQYFTSRFYQQAKELVTRQWNYTGLSDTFETIGSGKGRESPGHSIMPNLFMYEVAKRDGDPDADNYFNAAYRQTQWIIKHLDWKDPRTTKGQRMSEHVLIPALVYFLKHYPDKAPAGLKDKITQWTDVAISRSDNMWDFRRYDMENNWTLPDFSETGNITGLPGIVLAAASVTDDPLKQRRLQEIGAAAIDDLFGRNPQNAVSAAHKDLGFKGLEKSWPKQYTVDVCARLELVRGTFSSISTTAMYPYDPAGKFGHPEGWVAFNSAWNVSLAYLNSFDTRLTLMNKTFTLPQPKRSSADIIYIQLKAPVGSAISSIGLKPTKDGKAWPLIRLKETIAGSQIFRAGIKPEEIGLELPGTVKLSYGDALFERSVELTNKNGEIILKKSDD